MKLHKMLQRSDEWFAIRAGKMSASHAQCIAANGKGLETYIYDLIAEKYAIYSEESFVSKDMQRGIDLEEVARIAYEIETGNSVQEVGFVELDEYVGCSPDGLVGEDGGIEIKCVNNSNFFKAQVKGITAVEAKYIWQVQMCLLITGAKWWDLVLFNPNYEESTIIHRILPDQDKFDKLELGLEKGRYLIKKIEQEYANNAR